MDGFTVAMIGLAATVLAVAAIGWRAVRTPSVDHAADGPPPVPADRLRVVTGPRESELLATLVPVADVAPDSLGGRLARLTRRDEVAAPDADLATALATDIATDEPDVVIDLDAVPGDEPAVRDAPAPDRPPVEAVAYVGPGWELLGSLQAILAEAVSLDHPTSATEWG